MDDDTNLAAQTDEIEVLSAIYGEEFVVDSEAARKYIVNIDKDIRLLFRFPDDYPSNAPPYYELDALQLNGEDRNIISDRLNEIYTENIGLPVIYEWVQMIKDYITAINPDPGVRETKPVAVISSNPTMIQPEPIMECPEIFHDEPMVDRKSVFQAHVAIVLDTSQVNSVMRKLLSNKKIADATHNIQAFRIKLSNDSISEDCDDDGESHAGGRLLHLLNIIDAVNVVVVVSRWYGGIQLGPDRFKHINNCARNILEKHGFISNKNTSGKKGSSKS